MSTDIIIIGAGIAGLSAARALASKGRSVLVIEARERAGGRIHTINGDQFTVPTELGAEFIHGAAPHTHKLLKEASIGITQTESNSWEVFDSKLGIGEAVNADMEEIMGALHKLKEDMSIAEFLRRNFGGASNSSLRQHVTSMVEGFDAADTEKISSLSLRDEWSDEDEFTGHRPVGGYGLLANFLMREANLAGAVFLFSSPVREIKWTRQKVEVVCSDGQSHAATKVIVTIPAAVLKHGAVNFTPALPAHQDAFQKTETGGVIKFLFEFKEAFWEMPGSGSRLIDNAGFIFSDAFVPTWWTQKPNSTPHLTGWLAGPRTNRIEDTSDLMAKGVQSLAYIFGCREDFIISRIRAAKIVNWLDDPFAMGAYGYKTLHTNEVLNVVNEPVEDTIFFAGEAFNDGEEMGTVEAALHSADGVVTRIVGL